MLDLTKPVTTRGGFLCTDRKALYPVVALVKLGNDREEVRKFDHDGKYFVRNGDQPHRYDLIDDTLIHRVVVHVLNNQTQG